MPGDTERIAPLGNSPFNDVPMDVESMAEAEAAQRVRAMRLAEAATVEPATENKRPRSPSAAASAPPQSA